MEPPGVNSFERLPEDLVRNILERVLWSPFEFGITKAKRKLHLLLCKQFWRTIPALEMLDWDVDNAKDELKLLQFVSEREEGLPLKRLSLNLAHPSKMQGILQTVIPPGLETLEEIYLFLGDNDEEAWVDWHTVLSLLQECKNLGVLHIAIWAALSPTSGGRVLLETHQLPPKPFPALQSLTLFGFSFRGKIKVLLQSFPALENLELHHMAGQNLDPASTPLKKFYAWGRSKPLGMNRSAPALASVPRSLAMLPGFLRSGDLAQECAHKDGALGMLRELTLDAACLSALGKLPQWVETLVGFVFGGEVSAERKVDALEMLRSLSFSPGVASRIVDQPGALEQLGALLNDGAKNKQVLEAAAELLYWLACNDEVKEIVARKPCLLRELVPALSVDATSGRAAKILFRMGTVAGVAEAITGSDVYVTRLTNLLDMKKSGRVQAAAASILLQLKMDGEGGAAMSRVETFVQQQLDTMVNGAVGVRRVAAEVVKGLVDIHGMASATVPGLLEALVAGVGKEGAAGGYIQEVGADSLWRLTYDDEARKAAAKIPGVFQNLVKGLNGSDDVKRAVLTVLHRLALDEESVRAIRETPGCVTKALALLEGNVSLRVPAAALLSAIGEEGAIPDLSKAPHEA